MFNKKNYIITITLGVLSGATAHANEIAYDLHANGPLNLISYTNVYEGYFSSAGDGFQKYQRGVSSTIPFGVLDDTLFSFPPDSVGIIDDNNLQEFFGVVDTVNGDHSGDVSAEWSFDITGATDIAVSIDMGTMGDFENSDEFTWSASIDGGVSQVLFSAQADESASHVYSLASGKDVLLNDPMMLDGIVLSNTLQTFVQSVNGVGSVLTLTLDVKANGGSEAFAFQNIVIHDGYDSGENGGGTGPTLALIHNIQGDGNSSPMVGDVVTVEAIIVGDFQNNVGADNGQLRGFYIQEEDVDADANAQTSEGIFVYDGSGGVDVAIGDKVRVTGEVKEHYGLTEIDADSVEILASAQALPVATEMSLPVVSTDAFENVEGMRVAFPQALTISEYYNFDRFGEIVLAQPLAGEQRPMTPTAMEAPDSAAYAARAEANALSRITLDDGRTSQNPDPAMHPSGAVFDLSNRFRGGDLVQGAEGVMDYRFSLYRLQPTVGANHIVANPRPTLVPHVGGDMKVASFNVLNYFTTLDQDGNLCGPSALGCRGADNATEFTRQRDKIIAAIAEIDADIVGLIEIENNATTAINDLVVGLNDAMGPGTYAALNTGTIGGDAIKVAFIYKPSSVSTSGAFAVLDSSVDSRFIDDKNRPTLAQTFEQTSNGAKLTVVVNHFKSKGSNCNALGDPDAGDGQGNCNGVRTDAAEAMRDWLMTDPTNSGDKDILIIGDLNAYDKEDPITALTAAGYNDLIHTYEGEEAYTYVFSGQFGYLDYALANTSLNSQVNSARVWHINADEPDILDYDTSYKKAAQDTLYEANAFRSSDHDPVIVGLTLNAPPICDLAVASKTSLWPVNHKFVPVEINGVIDPDNDPVMINITSIMQNEPLTGAGDSFLPDAVLGENGQFSLRAERAGGKGANGRVYIVGFEAMAEGGSCQGEVKVNVPHNKSAKGAAVDDGLLYLSY